MGKRVTNEGFARRDSGFSAAFAFVLSIVAAVVLSASIALLAWVPSGDALTAESSESAASTDGVSPDDSSSRDQAASNSGAPSVEKPPSAQPLAEDVAASPVKVVLEKTIVSDSGYHYTVSVEYMSDAGIPEGAELSVAWVMLTPEGYDPNKPEFKDRPTEEEAFVSAAQLAERVSELTKVLDVREGDEAFYTAFLDISLNVDGNVVKLPDGVKVKVTVETDAVEADQANRLRASFFTEKKPGAEHADPLGLEDRSGEPAQDKKYEKGAKVTFETDKLSELGLMGVITAEELAAEQAEAEAATGADNNESVEHEQDVAEPSDETDVETTDAPDSGAAQETPKPSLSTSLVAASNAPLARVVNQYSLLQVADALGEEADSYTVTWVDDEGAMLKTDVVAAGEAPAAPSVPPTKAPTAQYTYAFAGWSNSLDGRVYLDEFPEVTEDVVYVATFTSTVNTYMVVWTNDDGTVLETDEDVPYGTMPEYNGAEPSKDGYRFGLWEPDVAPVEGDVTYKAVFTQSPVEFLVRDHSTGAPLSDAHLTLTNDAGIVVWEATTTGSGLVWVKQVGQESAGGDGAEFKPNSTYTLKQTSADSAYICPAGSWTLKVAEDGKTFSLTVNADVSDMSTWRASGPYGARFYLDNVAASTVTYKYNYPAGITPEPEDEKSSLPELAYDYRYLVQHEDPAIDGYTFVGWQVDGTSTYAHEGDTISLDTLSRATHTMVAQWRIPLSVQAYTYAKGDRDHAMLEEGSEGIYAIPVERSLTFGSLANMAEAYGQQNTAVHELGASTDYSFAFATLQPASGEAFRVYAMQYDAAIHAWQYKESEGADWTNIDKGAQLNLYYTQDLVEVKWVQELEDGSFTVLDAAQFPGKSVAVSYDWVSTDALVSSSERPVVQGSSYYSYLGFGDADAASSSALSKSQLQSFSLKNSEDGFRFSESGSGDGEPVAGDTIFVVYSETPPESSVLLAIENHSEWPYKVSSIFVGGELAANDWLANGNAVLVNDDGTLQVMAAQDTVAADATSHLVLLGAGAKAFVVDGGFIEEAAAGTIASAAVASSTQIVRTTLVKTSNTENGLANTKSVTRGVLEEAPAEVVVSFDSDLSDLAVSKTWSDDSYPSGFKVDFALYENSKACTTDAANARGVYTMQGDEWAITIPNLPTRLAYSVSETAVRNSAGNDITADFQATYTDDEEQRAIAVYNTRTSDVCQVGDRKFRTVKEAVEYIEGAGMTTATIEMLSDYIMAESGSVEIPSGYSITLTSVDVDNPNTITRGFAGAAEFFAVHGGLTIENVKLTGQLGKAIMAKDGNGGLVHVAAGAVLTAGDGAQLAYGRASNGSAIYAESGATVNLDGVRVTSCQAISGGAVGVADDTVRIRVSGDTYVHDNRDGDNRDQYNLFLDQDSNEVIQVVGEGLGSNALVGVRVPNGDSASTQYNAHGAPAKPFATYAESAKNDNLAKLTNDRLNSSYSNYGSASEILPNTVVWGETFNFTVNVQWLDDKFNEESPVPDGAQVTLRLNNGYVTPRADGVVPTTVVLVGSDSMTYTFEGLARYDGSGNPYKYTVSETSIAPTEYRRVIFAGDKAVNDNPLTYSAATGNDQVAFVSNYYRYTELTVEKKAENLPAGQTISASFSVYRVAKDGMVDQNGIRYGGVGSVSDLPLALRNTEFTTEGGNRWHKDLGGSQVKFHKFYDIAFREFEYNATSGIGALKDGTDWQPGDVVRFSETGDCSVRGEDEAWHALGTRVPDSYIQFSRQDGRGGVESAGGTSAGKGCTIRNVVSSGSGTYTFTKESHDLSSDYYYYVVETQVSESGGMGRVIGDSHKLVATYDPQYEYDQLAQKVTVTNTYRNWLSVDKRWSDDVTNPGTCEFEVYRVLGATGSTAEYLDDPVKFEQLVKANFDQWVQDGKVAKQNELSFSLPETDTDSWVHVLEDLDVEGGVYFAREVRSGGIAILNPDVSDTKTSVDAVYSYDKNVNQITVKNLSGVLCKIDDRSGEHPFRTLKDALAYGRTRENGESNTEFTIQMLRDYSIPSSDIMQIASGEHITLTTASTVATGAKVFVYSGDAGKTKATIERKAGNTWPFVTMAGTAGASEGTSFTLENIELDGGSTSVNFRIGNTTYYNGGLIYATNATVVLQEGGMDSGGDGTGVVVRNGKANNGGAIYAVSSNVSVSDAAFENCVSTDTNGSVDRGGGAIWTSGISTMVENSTFAACTAARAGGAVASMYKSAEGDGGEETVITGCTFTDCTSNYYGGAVYSRNATLTVGGEDASDACTFTRCEAMYRGGGVHHENTMGTTDVRNCTFDECKMTAAVGSNTNANGGGGLCTEANVLNLRDCTFTNGYAYVRGGGAIHFNLSAEASNVSNCTFTNCTTQVSGGGGLEDVALTQTISDCTFTDCAAPGSAGGGIDVGHFNYDKNVVVTNCEFTRCEAGGGDGGGGICTGGETLTVIGCTFDECKTIATSGTINGGAISMSPGGEMNEVDVYGCTFTNCAAAYGYGGAIYSKGIVLRVGDHPETGAHTTFTNCSARNDGGAIDHYWRGADGASLFMENVTFSNCTSTAGSGGAVYDGGNSSADTTLVVANVSFADCSAQSGHGGAVRSSAAAVTVSDSDFNNCSARYHGGALGLDLFDTYYEGSSLRVTDSTFSDCNAGIRNEGYYGGAIYTDTEAFELTGREGVITFDNCTSWGAGGAIYHSRGDRESASDTFTDLVFENCVSKSGSGGSIYTCAPSVALTRIAFQDGTCMYSGGAINQNVGANFMDKAQMNVVDCTFKHLHCGVDTTSGSNVHGGAIFTNTRLLTVTGQQEVLTFEDCFARGSGGAICHDRNNNEAVETVITDCSFKECEATRNSGGAVYSNAPVATLTNLSFEGTRSYWSGGAVYRSVADSYIAQSNTTITGCTFKDSEAGYGNTENNTGSHGGAIYDSTLILNVQGQEGVVTFNNTKARGSGGAVYQSRGSEDSAATFTQCSFDTCTASTASGGAIAAWATTLTVRDASFSHVSTRNYGGAIYHEVNGSSETRFANGATRLSHIVVNDATTQNESGGGVSTSARTLVVDGQGGESSFTDCTARKAGGAIRHNNANVAATTTISDCDFTRCEGAADEGGGVWTQATRAVLSRCDFVDCTAYSNGGGLCHRITNSDQVATCSTTVEGCSFTNCDSTNQWGGGMRAETLTLDVTSTSFDGCDARWGGGGIYQARNSEGSTFTLDGCGFANCTVWDTQDNYETGGGAVNAKARVLDFKESVFEDCSAKNRGGIIMHADVKAAAEATIADCRLSGGEVSEGNGQGGGIYFTMTDATLIRTTIENCSASARGGAIYKHNSYSLPLVLDDCELTGNYAGNYGGAVFFDSNNTITLRNGTSITGNTLGTTTVENAAGVYILQDRGQATLVLGSVDAEDDTITVYDNTTSSDMQSNVRLIRSGTYDKKTQRYYDRADSVSLLSNLTKPGVGATGSIGVVNPGPENTQFGVGDVGGHTGVEYIVSDIDTQYGKLDPADHEHKKIIWYAPPVCKITDQYGWPLYYGPEKKTATFTSLKDAIEVLNVLTPGYLRDNDDVEPTQLQIQMLVPNYTLGEATPALKRDVTLTTANPGPTEFDYPMNATSATATVMRGAAATAGSLFTVSPGVGLTVKAITLDGGNRSELPLVVPANGGIVNVQTNASVTLSEGAVLCNSAVSDGNNGGAVYVTGGTNPDVPALVMDANATVSDCLAGNGAGVYLTGGVLFEMNDAPHIEGCTASKAGGAVYVSPYATMSFADNPNAVIRDNAVADASGAGAGIYLPDNNSKLNLKLGRAAVIADNYVLGTDDDTRQNGFESYPLLRQDIFLGESGEPATSIVLTGDLSMDAGDIWVWADNATHYKTETQFAVIATDASGNPSFTPRDSSLALLRNARDDVDSENDTDSHLYGIQEDGVNVIWSYNTGSAKVVLRKVAYEDGSYDSLQGAVFTVYKGRSTRPYVVRHDDGTQETLSGLQSGDAGVFWIGVLPYGTYYLEETTTPSGFDASRKWFRLDINESGVSMSAAATSRAAL
ncbi:MAG: Cna B-type domain-containing protein [Eggerthellaceae bacterium]|nr:Cna B-type domain-containing protein [Eggerthellaceae bacterium]